MTEIYGTIDRGGEEQKILVQTVLFGAGRERFIDCAVYALYGVAQRTKLMNATYRDPAGSVNPFERMAEAIGKRGVVKLEWGTPVRVRLCVDGTWYTWESKPHEKITEG